MKETMNWHVVYTKPGYERKITHPLGTNAIQAYCPQYAVTKGTGPQGIVSHKLLFSRWVFVYCTEGQFSSIKHINGVINLVYWQNKPAVVSMEEVDTIRYVLKQFKTIELKKTGVLPVSSVTISEKNVFALPSLGYTILAEGEVAATKAPLSALPPWPMLEVVKVPWSVKSIHSLLSGLPTLLLSRVTKNQTTLSRRLE